MQTSLVSISHLCVVCWSADATTVGPSGLGRLILLQTLLRCSVPNLLFDLLVSMAQAIDAAAGNERS